MCNYICAEYIIITFQDEKIFCNVLYSQQWFSTCGPWPTDGPQRYFAVGHRAFWFEKVVFARWAIYSLTLSESLQKFAANGEFSLKTFFFLEITCFRPEIPFQSNSRLMKIWVKFLSNTLRVGPWKWATVRKRLGTTGIVYINKKCYMLIAHLHTAFFINVDERTLFLKYSLYLLSLRRIIGGQVNAKR